MRRFAALCLLLLSSSSFAQPADPPVAATPSAPASNADATPSASPEATTDVAAAAANAPIVASAASDQEQQAFNQYRRDLVNLLALRADADLLLAAAELAYFDKADAKRSARLKSPALLARAQKFGPDSALVWWVSALLDCDDAPNPCPHAGALQKLESLDAGNAAVWLLALSAEKDAGKQRALLSSMAQATRFDDYWGASVLAVYNGLEVLPVPQDVLDHGVNSTAARLNFATRVGGNFKAPYEIVSTMCREASTDDSALVADCLAIARAMENGSTFVAQMIAVGIEETLLPAGVARDVLRARKRTAAWQREQFGRVSGRFAQEPELAKAYLHLLQTQKNELSIVAELLRGQGIRTEAPVGWEAPDPLGDSQDSAPRH